MFGFNDSIRIKRQSTFSGNFSFRFPNMFFLEEKLPIEITHINCIQVNLKEEK